MRALFLGVDVGTASTKGVLVDASGEMVASARRDHATANPHPGWFEHDPIGIWWDEAAGGGTTDRLWPQFVSDISHHAQDVPRHTVGAALGDAMLAAQSTGHADQSACRAWNPIGERIDPDPGVAQVELRHAQIIAEDDVPPALPALTFRRTSPDPFRQVRIAPKRREELECPATSVRPATDQLSSGEAPGCLSGTGPAASFGANFSETRTRFSETGHR